MNNPTATIEELKATLDAWIPKYIRQVVELRSGNKLTAERYNELMNLLITQGDDTIELAQVVKQYVELLVDGLSNNFVDTTDALTQAFNTTTANVAAIAEGAVDTAEGAVASVTQYKSVMDANMEQFQSTVNNAIANMTSDIDVFKTSITESFDATDAKSDNAVATANQLVADMEGYRVDLSAQVEQTFRTMRDSLSAQVSSEVAVEAQEIQELLTANLNTAFNNLSVEVTAIADSAVQIANGAVEDVVAYKASMNARLEEALKEVEDSLTAAEDVIKSAAEIYDKIDEIDAAVKSFEGRVEAVENSVESIKDGTTPVAKAAEADNAKTLDGHGAEYFAPNDALEDYLPKDANAVSASKLATKRSITIGDKANDFDGGEPITFSRSDMKVSRGDETTLKITNTGWYEIARTDRTVPSTAGLFMLTAEGATASESVMFMVGESSRGENGRHKNEVFTVLSCDMESDTSKRCFTSIRVLNADGNLPVEAGVVKIEIYQNLAEELTYTLTLLGGTGWKLRDTPITGSLSGCSGREMTLERNAIKVGGDKATTQYGGGPASFVAIYNNYVKASDGMYSSTYGVSPSIYGNLTVNGPISCGNDVSIGGKFISQGNTVPTTEEGTFTMSSPNLQATVFTGNYVKVGSLVYAWYKGNIEAGSTEKNILVSGLPFVLSSPFVGYFAFGGAPISLMTDLDNKLEIDMSGLLNLGTVPSGAPVLFLVIGCTN